MKPKQCPICNEMFVPKSSRQKYCKKEIIKKCPVCGDDFIGFCAPDSPTTCTKKECKRRAGAIASINIIKTCKLCGREFKPTSSVQEYCNLPVTRTCEFCGKLFEIKCTGEQYKIKTCSEECMQKLASVNRQKGYMQQTLICELCGLEFHPKSNTQRVCERTHYNKCIVCGKSYVLPYKSSIGQIDLRQTCSSECLSKYRSKNNPFSDPEIRERIKQTMLEKYGVEHPAQNEEIQKKMFATYKDNTGYDHPSHNPNTLKGKRFNVSSLETKLANVLNNNQIEFETQKLISKDGVHHAFDFYLPKYKMYIDVDGVYYHGYLDDSNGGQISEDRDAIRTYLIEEGEIYTVVVESEFKNQVEELLKQLAEIDSGTFSYESYMFDWCRAIDFPYPEYEEDRMKKDYANLCKYDSTSYDSHAKLGFSSIRNFHRSIYDARVGNSISIKEAWEDDTILKKVIKNRMIYCNKVDPSKILAGFYISKIVPKISIFNPVLARYLTLKYLNKYREVLDPFSGYSGRMLGVCSTGKEYFGMDINETTVHETNEIIKFHDLLAIVDEANILDDTDVVQVGESLLTCPPYSKKETYGTESQYRTCDEWIDIVLHKYNCKRYVFVVDSTDKYKLNVTENIVTKSYFSTVVEKVIVIDK